MLEIGATALGGLALPDLLRMRAAAQEAGRASEETAVIVVWLQGGPSQFETYDLKPDAPAEIRGEFRPIATRVPGMQVCELLPLHAQVADRFTLIRSISHEYSDHGRGTWRMLTGREQPQKNVDGPPFHPEMGSLVDFARQSHHRDVPNFVVVGRRIFRRGYARLGPAYAPFIVGADQNATPDFQVRNLGLQPGVVGRLDDRRQLLRSFDRLRREIDHSGIMQAMDRFDQQAVSMLTGRKLREAFDLEREPARVQARYGGHKWGRRALLARRLVEAGCSLVHVVMSSVHDKGRVGSQTVNWDDHGNGAGERRGIFVSMKDRLPVFDRVVSALVEDIYARGLDRKVMVVIAGEFGRSPRIYSDNPKQYPGREHHSRSMSVAICGGGVRTGQVIGATTADGDHPKTQPLDPNDLLATVYRHLGIDTEREVFEGPLTKILPSGRPISAL